MRKRAIVTTQAEKTGKPGTGEAGEGVVDGIVLAAGRSTRMGASKPLLELDGETFLEHAIRTLRAGGCRFVVAVVNEAADWTQRLADVTGAAVVINEDADSEQVDSVRLALEHVPDDAAAVAVLPVDFPRLRATTVRALLAVFRTHRSPIVLPAYRGETGHPVVLARALFDELRTADLAEGVRSLIAAHADAVQRVAVDDAGILIDIDTPADYRRHLADE
jgi:molybdenum cofactor cytidylyltransferase